MQIRHIRVIRVQMTENMNSIGYMIGTMKSIKFMVVICFVLMNSALHGNNPLREIVTAYGKVRENLLKHEPGQWYTPVDPLRTIYCRCCG